MKPLVCPLCDAEMEHHELHKRGNINLPELTYIWVCPECPGILIEWHQHEDTQALDKYLRGQ